MVMLLLDMLTWWYGRGWLERMQDIGVHMANWSRFFSLGTLMLTLFQPWKQIVTNPGPNGGLAARRSAFIDNLVSRFVGFFVRIFVALFGLGVLTCVLVMSVGFVVLWPLLPLMPLIAIIVGFSV